MLDLVFAPYDAVPICPGPKVDGATEIRKTSTGGLREMVRGYNYQNALLLITALMIPDKCRATGIDTSVDIYAPRPKKQPSPMAA
jgi:hypothetical protein